MLSRHLRDKFVADPSQHRPATGHPRRADVRLPRRPGPRDPRAPRRRRADQRRTCPTASTHVTGVCHHLEMTSAHSRAATAALIAKRDRAFKPLVDRGRSPAAFDAARGWTTASPPSCARSPIQLLATRAATTIHGRVVEACGARSPLTRSSRRGTRHCARRPVAPSRGDGRPRRARARQSAPPGVARPHERRRRDPRRGRGARHRPVDRPDVPHVHDGAPRRVAGRDCGVRRGWSTCTATTRWSAQDLRAHGERFAGYRSAVAWYCWATADDDAWRQVASPACR